MRFVEPIERADLLDPATRRLAGLVDKIIKPGVLRDLLRGRWLGHPVHPSLTDLPIGFWTTSWLLDIAGGRRARNLSDAMIGVGLVCAAPTIAAGLTDWSQARTDQQRVGLVHGATMLATTALYAGALASRKDRRRRLLLAQAGAATATAGAALGGHLVYVLGTGVRPRS